MENIRLQRTLLRKMGLYDVVKSAHDLSRLEHHAHAARMAPMQEIGEPELPK